MLGESAAHREDLELLREISPGMADQPPTSSARRDELFSPGMTGPAIWAWGSAAWMLPPGQSDLVLKLSSPALAPVHIDFISRDQTRSQSAADREPVVASPGASLLSANCSEFAAHRHAGAFEGF